MRKVLLLMTFWCALGVPRSRNTTNPRNRRIRPELTLTRNKSEQVDFDFQRN
jgi:hypothetical protein